MNPILNPENRRRAGRRGLGPCLGWGGGREWALTGRVCTRWAHLSFPGNVCCRPPSWVDGPLRRWNGTFLLQRWLGCPRDATAYPADPNLGPEPPGQRGGFRLPTAEPGRTAWPPVTAHDLSEQGPAPSWLTAPPLGDTTHAHLCFQVRSVGDTVSHPRPWCWVHPISQLPGVSLGVCAGSSGLPWSAQVSARSGRDGRCTKDPRPLALASVCRQNFFSGSPVDPTWNKLPPQPLANACAEASTPGSLLGPGRHPRKVGGCPSGARVPDSGSGVAFLGKGLWEGASLGGRAPRGCRMPLTAPSPCDTTAPVRRPHWGSVLVTCPPPPALPHPPCSGWSGTLTA